jgi:hypothetical protein
LFHFLPLITLCMHCNIHNVDVQEECYRFEGDT